MWARFCDNSNGLGCKRSSVDMELLILAKFCKVAKASGCTDCTTGKDSSSQAIPKRNKTHVRHVVLLVVSNMSGCEWSSADAELLVLARLRNSASELECAECATDRNVPS
jgi:hypothetical protein